MLKEKINADYLAARKQGNKEVADILRLLVNEIKNEEVNTRSEINDDTVITLVKRQVKSANKLIKETEGTDRAAEAKASADREIEIVSAYLPKMLSYDEIKAILVDKGADKSMPKGQLMGMIMKDHKAEVDGQLVNQVVTDFIA